MAKCKSAEEIPGLPGEQASTYRRAFAHSIHFM